MSPPPPRRSDESLAAGLIAKPVKSSPTRVSTTSPRPSRLRGLVRAIAIATLFCGAGTLIAASAVTSVVLMLQPQPPRWLARHLPNWSQNWGELTLHTLADIDTDLAAQGRSRGDLIDLTLASDDPQLRHLTVLPIYETRSPCTQSCDTIVELRLYELRDRQTDPQRLQLRHQLAIQGPTEAEVLEPLARGDIGTLGSTYQLPLAALKPLHESGLPGGWFTLTGRWRTQGPSVLYGQILYINPQTLTIHSLLNWQSQSGRLPAWLDVDGKSPPELLVNQSAGLEPQLNLYSVSNLQTIHTPTRLATVELATLPLPPGLDAAVYRDGLFLAQQALWSEAEQQFQQLQQSAPEQWPTDLEQQHQLISLHARISRRHADRAWSQPGQMLLALLLDGQWSPALASVQTSPRHARAVLPLLERDSTRIWQRLTASLKVNPDQTDARLWAALILMVKEDEAAAIAWLTDDNKTPALKSNFEEIALKVTPPDPAETAIVAATANPEAATAAATAAPTRSPRLSSLIGVARPLDRLDSDAWFFPSATPPDIPPGQQWYAITLHHAHGQQTWQALPSAPAESTPAAIATYLQRLGLATDAPLSLISATAPQVTTAVQVKAVQWSGGQPTLLGQGRALTATEPLLATRSNQWHAIANQSTQPLLSLIEQDPDLSDRVMATLYNHLGFESAQFTTALRLQANSATATATVQWVNMASRDASDLLLTIPASLATYLGLSIPPETAIHLLITPQGELIYSSLWQGTTHQLIGWVQPPASVPALVERQGDRWQVLTWSPQSRRFN